MVVRSSAMVFYQHTNAPDVLQLWTTVEPAGEAKVGKNVLQKILVCITMTQRDGGGFRWALHHAKKCPLCPTIVYHVKTCKKRTRFDCQSKPHFDFGLFAIKVLAVELE